MDRELKREVILDNYNNPYHKGLKGEAGYKKANTNNESCFSELDFNNLFWDNNHSDILTSLFDFSWEVLASGEMELLK